MSFLCVNIFFISLIVSCWYTRGLDWVKAADRDNRLKESLLHHHLLIIYAWLLCCYRCNSMMSSNLYHTHWILHSWHCHSCCSICNHWILLGSWELLLVNYVIRQLCIIGSRHINPIWHFDPILFDIILDDTLGCWKIHVCLISKHLTEIGRKATLLYFLLHQIKYVSNHRWLFITTR
jgi:hypothetical protein